MATMAPEQSEKVRENRLRAMATRQGLAIQKSRRRDPMAIDFDRWMIVDLFTGKPVAGTGPGNLPNMTLDGVEAYLRGDR
jgi:hypothetical protein